MVSVRRADRGAGRGRAAAGVGDRIGGLVARRVGGELAVAAAPVVAPGVPVTVPASRVGRLGAARPRRPRC